MAKVSVVVTSYNQLKYIKTCLDSIRNQTYKDLEIVVCDDGSTDGSWEFLTGYASDFGIRVYQNEKNLKRVGNYRRLVYELAQGDWILNVDGDDYLEDQFFIEDAVKAADEDPSIVIVSADRFCLHEDGSKKPQTCGLGEGTFDGREYILSASRMNNVFFHLTSVYRRKEATEVGFHQYDILSSDAESLMKLCSKGNVRHISRPVACWRLHDENASRTLNIDSIVENLKYYNRVAETFKQAYPGEASVFKKWQYSYTTLRISRLMRMLSEIRPGEVRAFYNMCREKKEICFFPLKALLRYRILRIVSFIKKAGGE